MSNYPLKWITDHLAVGYSPKSYDDLDFIKAQGIGAIVNLCAECYDLHEIEGVTVSGDCWKDMARSWA